MEYEHGLENSRGRNLLERLTDNWSQRAAVRSDQYIEIPEPVFDANMLDFPVQLLPFRSHSYYLDLNEEKKRLVQTLAWIAWNKRVVDTEEMLVGPALMAMMSGATGIELNGKDRTAIRQTLIDEFFHSHMHEVAVKVTMKERGISKSIADRLKRPSCSFRSYAEAAATFDEQWKKDIARIAWVVVGELSIYEFLRLVSEDITVQKCSRELLTLHERDEAAHASVIAQIMRDHFLDLSKKEQSFFIHCLPLAIKGFSQEDWVVWRDVLELADVDKAVDIVNDVQSDASIPNNLPLLRSYSRVEDLCNDLGFNLIQ